MQHEGNGHHARLFATQSDGTHTSPTNLVVPKFLRQRL